MCWGPGAGGGPAKSGGIKRDEGGMAARLPFLFLSRTLAGPLLMAGVSAHEWGLCSWLGSLLMAVVMCWDGRGEGLCNPRAPHRAPSQACADSSSPVWRGLRSQAAAPGSLVEGVEDVTPWWS